MGRLSILYTKVRNSNIQKTLLQFGTLSSGNLLTVLITLFSYPILSRLYTANEFGEFALFQSILVIILPLATLNYQEAIILVNQEERLEKLLSLLLFMTLVFTGLVTLFISISGFELIGVTITRNVLWVLPISLLAASALQISQFTLLRKEKFKIISLIKVSERAGFNVAAIFLAFLKGTINGLVLGLLSGQLISLLVIKYKKANRFRIAKPAKLERAILRKYSSFALFSLPGGFLERLSRYLPIILLSSMVSEAVTGQYAMAYKVLSLPEVIAGASLGNIFYLRASKRYTRLQKISPLIVKTWLFSILIALVPMIVILFFGSEIFIIVLGSKWQQSGVIASTIVPMMFVLFITSPVSYALNVLNKQDVDLKIGVVTLISRSCTLIIGLEHLDLHDAFKLFVAVEVFILLILNAYLMKLVLRWEKTLAFNN